MGCFWRSESHWTKHNTMRVLILLLVCALVVTGVATAETIRTMNTLAIIALSLSLIGAFHLALDLVILTSSTLNKIYIAILYSILIVCWITISGVELLEVGGLSHPGGAFNLNLSYSNWAGCNARNMTFSGSPGKSYVTHCKLPIVRCSASWVMVVLYIVACVYVTKEEKRSIKMFGRSKVQGSNEVEGLVADPPSGGYPDRVVRVVIGEQGGEIPETSLDQDYPKGDIEKVFLQYAKG